MSSHYSLSVPAKLFISTLFFGTGWFSLSFTFPLLAQEIGYSYAVIGIIGFTASLPFPIVAYLYTRSGQRALRLGTVIPLLTLAALSMVFYVFYRSYFIPLTLIASVVQAPWWISTEISIGSFSGQRNAEKYSAGWGIPNAIAPIIMGVVIQLTGYDLVFIIAMAAFIVAVLFSPRPERPVEGRSNVALKKRYLFSLFFAGVFSGFLYFVLEPVMKAAGFSYVTIGAVISLYGIISAIGYVSLHYARDLSIASYSIISAAMIFPTALVGAFLNIYTVIIAIVLAGFGVSISMSKVLSYISTSSEVKRGVFFYETFFGTGFMCGSFLQDLLFQLFGGYTISIVFSIPIFYVLSLWLFRRSNYLAS